MNTSVSRLSLLQIWRWPVLLAALTMFGLLAALIGRSSVWLALSWIALGIPPIVIALCVLMRRR